MRFKTLTAVILMSVFAVSGILSAASKFYVPDAVFDQYRKKYGEQAETRLSALLELMDGLTDASDDKKAIEVNKFFNQVQYQTDIKTWGQSDYWASRLEFLGVGMGDCEDYAVSKFLTLIQLGVPQEKLFLTYVKRGDRIPHGCNLLQRAEHRALCSGQLRKGHIARNKTNRPCSGLQLHGKRPLPSETAGSWKKG
ncbi:transglutaminase-like cysteine peptidase [Seleniivibrio woodruffii]|uniref:transglutaminase-like cysteine peptidase n=1 Tax=Seleniivibrio woodruffii TaxID=1078050 RepID=UPI0010491D16|nr:transglutaminase-like cysteine peptidase [Seleniivibrio woodruffii]